VLHELHTLKSHHIPSTDNALLHDPAQPPLRQHCVLQVQSAILVQEWLSQSEGLEHPEVLGITVMVLSGAESMSDPLNAVNDGTGKVVSRIHPASGGQRSEVSTLA